MANLFFCCDTSFLVVATYHMIMVKANDGKLLQQPHPLANVAQALLTKPIEINKQSSVEL